MLNITQIPAPRVKLIDEKTGLMSREWFVFFNNIYTIVGANLGVVQIQNGGTGLGDFPTNGQLLIGNAGEYKLNTLGYGSGISVTNGAGSITVSNTGVLSNIANAGISVSGATGNVTIANTGVLSLTGGTTGLTPNSATTGAITLAGTLIAANGGTGYASYAVGDLLYANTTTTLAKLPDVATGNALISGGITTAPAWGKIGLTTHVSGTLPIANGGTNSTATPTTGAVAYGTGTAYAFTAAGTTNQALLSAGAGVPVFTTLTTGSSILYGNGSGLFSNVTIGSGVSFVAGTLSATGTGGTVTGVTGTAPVVSSGGTTPAISMTAANTTTNGYLTSTDWNTFNGKGSGSVTSVSVVSSNGFAGTVATASTTPAITLSTTITGLLKGNGTAISAATSGTDYLVPSAPVTKTADFTVAAGETWIINNKTGSTCTVTLPSASAVAGRQLNFQNYQDQLLVSASSNVVPRAGGTAGTAILDAVAGNWATLISDGTNWVVMQASPYNVLLT